MAFAAYLFDLDGTLIDSTALILDSFHHVRKLHFGDRLPDERYGATMGRPLRDVFGEMTDDVARVQAMVDDYVEFNLLRHDGRVSAFAGVAQALARLAARAARLGVVTSKINEHAWRGLRVCGLDEHFELLIGADDVVRAKPDPEPVLVALRRLGVGAHEAVFIGDSPHDVRAGNAAGVATAAVAWGPFPRAALEAAGPTYWVQRAEELVGMGG